MAKLKDEYPVWNARRIYRKWRHVRGRDKNVCNIHLGRCGSSVVGSLLRQHPHLDWAGEYLGHDGGKHDYVSKIKDQTARRQYRRIEYRVYAAPTPVFGMEVKPWHMRKFGIRDDFYTFLDRLQEMAFGSMILLRRKNHLRRLVSILQLRETAVRHVRKERTAPARIRIDPRAVDALDTNLPIIEMLERADNLYREIEDYLERNDHLSVLRLSYEDDIEQDPMVAYRKVCDFTEIRPFEDVEVRLKRTNPFGLEDVILNFEEIEEILRPTRFAWMIKS